MNTSVRRLLCFATNLLLLALGSQPAFAAPTRAEIYRWKNVVIQGGGFVSGLVFHPTQEDLLYARTDVGGACRWDATHGQWIPLNDDIGRNHSQLLGVVSLALDPGDPRRLYLAGGSYLADWGEPAAILRSPDQGMTWSRTPLPFRLGGNQDGRSTGERLAVDPHDGTVLFLGSNQDGLWRSSDRALTWARVAAFPKESLTFVLFDPHGSADGRPTPVIYVGVNDRTGAALYRSTDAGATWAAVSGQPAGLLVQHAAIDSTGSLYLAYANHLGPNGATDGAVWKFTPADGRWTNITPVGPNPATKDTFGYAGLALDPRQPGVVMVSTLDRWTEGDEIFRSIDSGATWHPMFAGSMWDHSPAPYTRELKPHWIGGVALDPFNANQVFFTTGYGVWTTTQATASDHGAPTPWVFASAGLEETVVTGLLSPPEGAPLVSALGDLGGFRHDDLSVSPSAGVHHPFHGTTDGIDFAAHAPARMVRTYWGPARGAFSLDGGTSWQDFAATPPPAKDKGPGKIALSADGRRIVWLPKGSGSFYSTDNGVTWLPSQSSLVSSADYRTIGPVADRVNPDKFYIYDSVSGLFHYSTDGGIKFTPGRKLPADGGSLVAEPGREGRLWLPAPDGLYLSTDSGGTFRRVQSVQAAYQVGLGCAAASRTTPAIFLAGRVNATAGLFRSDDSGETWMAINGPGLQFGWLQVVTGDPRVPGRVYLGTGGRGIIYGEPANPGR